MNDIYQEWLELGKPKVKFQSTPELRDNVRVNLPIQTNPSLRPSLKPVATAVGIGVALYWIISEGSRLFPPRNLIPIP